MDSGVLDASMAVTGVDTPQTLSPWKAWIYGILLIAAGVYAYANSFGAPFIFDDQSAVLDSPYVRSLWPLNRAMSAIPQSTGAGRPILNLSLAINYHFCGMRVWGYHAVNLGIHLAVGLLLFGVIRRTLKLPELSAQFGRATNELAFAATLIWLVHPLQTESVTYIVQRAESIAALFYVGTIYGFLRGATGGGWAWHVAAVFSCALGMASKETVATAPLIVLMMDRFFLSGSFRRAIAERRKFYCGLAGTWVLLGAIMATGPRSESAGFGPGLPSPVDYALGQFEVIVHYLKLVFYPDRLCLDYAWLAPDTVIEAAIPIQIVIGLAAVTAWGFVRRSAWAFTGVWFFIILAPTSTFVPIADLAFEHRVYLPLAGITTLVVCGLYRMAKRLILTSRDPTGEVGAGVRISMCLVGWVMAAAAAGILTWRTRERNETYRSEISIWADVLEQRPGNARAAYNLASARYRLGEMAAAEAGLRRSIDLAPQYAAPCSLLGILLRDSGRPEEGLSMLRRAAELEPRRAEHFYNVGIILAGMGRDAEAALEYRRAIELQPDYSEAWYNLGNIAQRAGRWDEAAAGWTKAVELDPNAVSARFNLAGIHDRFGRREEARRLMDEALAIARTSAETDRVEGRLHEASAMQGKVVAILPGDADERLRWARDLAAEGRIDVALGQCEKAAQLGAESAAETVRREIVGRR